jgi:hypothetical protein
MKAISSLAEEITAFEGGLFSMEFFWLRAVCTDIRKRS